MSERGFHAGLLVAFVLAAASVAPLLVFVRAPYGRYARPGWGRMLPDRLGWALMELPAVAVFAACFAVGQRFSIAAIAFFALFGFSAHVAADSRLRRLRPSGYVIPQGGLFRWVSCPNYLGEIVEWSGWALATWSLPGLAFALWTAANLAPRALAHQRWYRERFADYPPERRVLVPGIW